jgi:CheY-like chemotaxis protein
MKRVLVIDDEMKTLIYMVQMLDYEGYEVRQAESGEEGFEVTLDWRPDLIVCDMIMPGMSGLDLLRTLRRNHIETPVIFMSATVDKELVAESMQTGAVNYLLKPFPVGNLLAVIDLSLS